ncbi:probable methyltransferase PMT26 [Medicago truncatula]|uniref:Methyltransferase PMT26-like protein, putative n=1 Tax=Medicago truncatula TaxID=3880 RepID=G7LE42_MEDTR|nr:probable methyltransferase PMT26 [Medicago truncatula]AET04764.1 methyltransferase PMT26-like protein, putative [Medicago truncatula]
MAQARYSRIDNKRSPSSYCSTVTIVVFVALCLVGLWMMTSSVVPVQNVDESTKNEVKGQSEAKDQATDITNSNPQNFEDKKGDLPQESTKEDNNAKQSENNHVMPKKQEEKSDEKPEDKSPEDTKMTYIDPNQNKKTSDSDESNNKSVSDESNNKSGSGEDNKKSDSDVSEKKSNSDEREKKSNSNDNKSGSDASENKKDESSETTDNKTEEKADQSGNQESDESSNEKKTDENTKNQGSNELLPSGAQSELLNETTTQTGSFSTQAAESKSETESQKSSKQSTGFNWKLCNVTAGPDYIPCLDNLQAIRNLKTTKHYEHRERQCPEDPPTCLVALPEGYKRPIEWPKSREKIWYSNVPHTKLAEYKGHQNWVKVTGEYLTFPGGGTQFKHGALHYIDTIQQSVPDIAWGKQTRVILDVGCGVASFGGFLFERDVLAMSFAPKDEHEAQVQFALERGIPAISAVMGTKRLPFPARVFDAIHCARCRVPWHIEGGKLLLELNRVLRPGGFFVWSATPIYQKLPEDVEIWNEMKALTKAMCWEVVSISRDKLNKVGIAVYKKPTSNECYEKRSKNEPSICQDYDDPNAAWNIPLQTCMHKAPVSSTERGSQWPGEWPERLSKSPYWLSNSEVGVYGKPAPEDFTADHEHWKRVVSKSYLNGIGIQWSNVRNVMDMRSVYGGFAAALMDLKIWVMNVVPVDSPDTLPIIYERGLFGIYHDWCESFSTYPRSYDLVHADHLFSKLKKRCKFEAVVAEVDRILRPEGKLIVRDTAETINELESLVTAMQWEVRMTYTKDLQGILSVQKSMWRPTELETVEYAIGSIPNSRQ